MLRARSEAMLAARMTPARDPAEQMRRDLEDTVASAMDSVVRAFYAPGPSREGAQFTGLSAWLTTTPT